MQIEERPWGTYQVLFDTKYCKVKQITVKPGQRLSLQLHNRRREHWYVVQGIATVTLGEDEYKIMPEESIDIGLHQKHRVSNETSQDLIFIEIQTGDYFGEDDIIRFQDDYSRV
jgi:mannose-6-phosphate isomerase-like protein (cupin superfamily)